MNTVSILLTLWILPLLGFANTPSGELREALSEAGVADRPVTPTFGELIVDPHYLADIKRLPSDRKKKLAAQLTRIIPRLSQERPLPTISREVSPVAGGPSPKLGILILQEIGTDEQKIEALRDLDLYGDSLYDACQALSTCEGAEGVKILKQYAEGKFTDLVKNGSQTSEGYARVKPDVRIYHAVIALAGAYHPDGSIVADKLRDQLIDLCKDRLDATRLAAVEKDFEKDMKEARHRRENLIREKRPNSRRNSSAGGIDTQTSSTSSNPSFVVIGSKKWFWIGVSIAVTLLGFGYWKFVGKR